MSPITRRPCANVVECLVLGLCAVLLVLASPFLALLIFTVRPIVLAGVLIAILAVVSPLVLVPRMRGRWQADIAPESAYKGLRLARDVGVHPGHTWAWIGDEEVVVGADDLIQAELGPIEEIDLPAQGRRVHQDEPLFRLRHGSRTLSLPAPVSGTVIRTNERLLSTPGLINQRPFSLGWVVRIRADEDLADARSHLFFGRRAWRWFRGEVDRLLRAVSAPRPPGDGVNTESLAASLYTVIDDETWRRLRVGDTALVAG